MPKSVILFLCNFFSRKLLIVISLFFTIDGYTQEDTRSFGVHEHGFAEVNIGFFGEVLVIELYSPADNLLGFESLPSSAEQQAQVRKVAQQLSQHSEVVSVGKSANCSLEVFEFSGPYFESTEREKLRFHLFGGEHEEDEHEKDEEDGEFEEGHSELELIYQFQCRRANKLTQLDFKNLFKNFSNFTAIEAQIITSIDSDNQQSQELTPERSIVFLKK